MCAAAAGPAWAGDCAGSLDVRRARLELRLKQPVPAWVFGGEKLGLPDLAGRRLAVDWQPGHRGALYHLVDTANGAATAIGGVPYPSPSGKRAVVVAPDSPYVWSGTEIWRLDSTPPHTEWEQDSASPADYALQGWQGEDSVLLAVRGLVPEQTAPLPAALVCADGRWHLIHPTEAEWLARYRSPMGQRHAFARQRWAVIWQNGEQVFAAPADHPVFEGWQDEDTAVFGLPDGDTLTVRHEDLWRAVKTKRSPP